MVHRANCAALALLLLSCGATITGCVDFGAPFSETRVFTAPVQAPSPLVVETVNGKVTVERAAVDETEVTAVVRARSQERLEATQIVAEKEGDALRLSVVWPAPGRMNSEGCSFEVRVPTAEGVVVRTSNGSILIEGLAGKADLRTSNGSIRVHDHAGPVLARTSNGSVVAQNVGGPVDVDSSNGSMTVSLAPENPGPIRATTSNGSIAVSLSPAFAGELAASTSNGRVRLTGGQATLVSADRNSLTLRFGDQSGAVQRSVLDTSNGSIRIVVRSEEQALGLSRP